MDVLVLYYRGERLRRFPLGSRAVEIGRSGACDIVVHDDNVDDRHWVVRRRGAEVLAYDVSEGSAGQGQHLSLSTPLGLGAHHMLCRELVSPPLAEPMTPQTDLVALPEHQTAGLSLVVDAGSRRRVRLRDAPVHVGSDAKRNDLVLSDPTVSGRHFRLDPDAGGYVLRDLGSRNGTWVEGIAVRIARIAAGARIRVGRTNLLLLPHEGARRSTQLVAESHAMKRLLSEASALARLSWPALVVGPSGAGKEGIARALHDEGPRAPGPFVAINAGGLPRHLVESELFGHEKGAFTGAGSTRRGVFEQAAGGTLFLDEIGELPHDLQSRLLRVLETSEVRRLGGEQATFVDVRVVAATHRDLAAMVREGRFREDLYYRLTRLVLKVPPLSERPADVPALAHHFLREVRDELGARRLSEAAIERLLAHRWPGNARELRNVVTSAAVATPAEVIQASDVDLALCRISPDAGPTELASLEAIVERHGGNLAAAARSLGVPRSTLRDRIKGPKRAAPPPQPAAEDVA